MRGFRRCGQIRCKIYIRSRQGELTSFVLGIEALQASKQDQRSLFAAFSLRSFEFSVDDPISWLEAREAWRRGLYFQGALLTSSIAVR